MSRATPVASLALRSEVSPGRGARARVRAGRPRSDCGDGDRSDTTVEFRGVAMRLPGTWHQRVFPRISANALHALTANMRWAAPSTCSDTPIPACGGRADGVLISLIDWSGRHSGRMEFAPATLPLRVTARNVGGFEGILGESRVRPDPGAHPAARDWSSGCSSARASRRARRSRERTTRSALSLTRSGRLRHRMTRSVAEDAEQRAAPATIAILAT